MLLAWDSLIKHTQFIDLPRVKLDLTSLLKVVGWFLLLPRLWSVQIHVELSGILIAVIKPHCLSVDNNILANDKVLNINEVIGILGAVPSGLLPLEQSALREPRINLLGLGNREGSIFEIEIEDEFA